MAFQFNFGSPTPTSDVPATTHSAGLPCTELFFSSHIPKLHLQPTRIHPSLLIHNPLLSTIHYNTPGHKDIEPGVYEGGLALWEAAIDLVAFLEKTENIEKYIKRKRIIELGCGAGIPGIYAIENGAQCVDFQDYVMTIYLQRAEAECYIIECASARNDDDAKFVTKYDTV
jgi:hypothetical protein